MPLKTKIYELLSKNRLNIFFYFSLAVICTVLYCYRLGGLVDHLSSNEFNNVSSPLGLHGIFHNSLFLPFKVLQSILFKLFNHSLFLYRLPSVIVGLISVAVFSLIVQLWHGFKPMVLASLLFSFSAFSLHVFRLGTYSSAYVLTVLVLVLCASLLQRYKGKSYQLHLIALMYGLTLTVPAIYLLVIANLVVQRRYINKIASNLELKQKLVLASEFLIWPILMIPSLTHVSYLKQYIGLAPKILGPVQVAKNTLAVTYHIFLHGPLMGDLSLGRLPILDAVSIFFALLGIYFYVTRFDSNRSKILITNYILGSIAIGLGGKASISICVVLIYLAIATGVAYFLHIWLKRFPKNPIARSIGISLIVVLIALSTVYSLKVYFVAWANDPMTWAIFSKKLN